jgi:hypothetical protein
MGAYENPEQIVDTQSGQHIRNLQATVAGAFSGYAQTYATREAEAQKELKKQQEINTKKLENNQKEVEDYALALRTKLNESETGNKELDLSATFEPLIQEAVKLKSGLLSGSITDRQGAIAKLAKINGTVSGFTDSLGEFDSYSQKLQAVTLKPTGTEGGLSADMPVGDVKAINIMEGRLPGFKKAVYEGNDPDKLVWEIYEKGNTTPIKRYYASKMKELDYYGDGDFIRSVPDMSVSNQKLKTTVTDIFDTKTEIVKGQEVREATGRVSDSVLKIKSDGTVDYKKQYIDESLGTYKMVAAVNKDKVMGNATLNTLLKSRVAGMSDSEIKIYNANILSKAVGAKGLSGIDALTQEQKDTFLKDYKEYFWKTQVSHTQDKLEQNANVQIFKDPEITKTTNKETKSFFSEAEVEEFKQRYKDLVSGTAETIQLPQKGKGVKIFKYNDTTGRVEEVNSKDEVLNSRVSQEDFQSYLGINPKTKPKLKGK